MEKNSREVLPVQIVFVSEEFFFGTSLYRLFTYLKLGEKGNKGKNLASDPNWYPQPIKVVVHIWSRPTSGGLNHRNLVR